jgi:predicted membrane-bound spermidine synthase/Na+-translocating ferredoxin:NAD+ oxidoreductase RnfG subunit
MKAARNFLIFCFGFFSIAAQTLLFREFITTFEGNDIGVGMFFGSWLLWIGVGALVVYGSKRLSYLLSRKAELWFLLYIPAFLLQLFLILHGRRIAGVESFELFSVGTLVLMAILANGPVSLITGILFPVICKWVSDEKKKDVSEEQRSGLAVSWVYILEAAGSFAGGLAVTVLLGTGVEFGRVFFILIFLVALSVFLVQCARGVNKWSILLPVFAVCCMLTAVDKDVSGYIRRSRWVGLLGKRPMAGSFQTAQAEYLYGFHDDQFVIVSQGGTHEVIPDDGSAARAAAICLCQNPDAQKVMVVGGDLNLCKEFLKLVQIEHVTWIHPDTKYVQKIESVIPAELWSGEKRLFRPGEDIRMHLSESTSTYDIVILNLPQATSSVLNRYYSLEFYELVKSSLKVDGLLAVGTAGGENVMGGELINLGASVKLTLSKVFSNLVITPGEQTWFLTSDSEHLTGQPGILRDRLASIEEIEDIFPPEGLYSVYLPERASKALAAYDSANLPEKLLVNRDVRPLANLYSLLLAAKQSGSTVTHFIKGVGLAGVWFFIIPVLVLFALRSLYVAREPLSAVNFEFESMLVVFSAGWCGIGVMIVLLYMYQTQMGSLYLHIGMISSLFMTGLTIGAAVGRTLLKKQILKVSPLLITAVVLNVPIICFIAYWPAENWDHVWFGVAFVFCGLCTGTYYPVAANEAVEGDCEIQKIGAKLEIVDHVGAAIGGFVTSLMIIPALGSKASLLVFAVIMAGIGLLWLLRSCKPDAKALSGSELLLRRAGYAVAGAVLIIGVWSNLLFDAWDRLEPSLSQAIVKSLAEDKAIELKSSTDSGKYYMVYDESGDVEGYVFSSAELAKEVRGFGGRIDIAIYTDTAGQLIDFAIVKSNETSAYMDMLSGWTKSLAGCVLFDGEKLNDVQAVTGATVSSEAIISALKISGRNFAEQILGKQQVTEQAVQGVWQRFLPDAQGWYLLGAFAGVLAATYRPNKWARMAFLVCTLAIGGFWLNAQYSTEQVKAIGTLSLPAIGLTGSFILAGVVLVFVLIFGNFYCGYICPFGAAQELACYATGGLFKQELTKKTMRTANTTRYGLLAIMITLFYISRNTDVFSSDFLVRIFSKNMSSILLWTVISIVVLSIFYNRFWCRFLCPAGAFLSLVGMVSILGRYLPAKKFGRCEFGFSIRTGPGCLCCDRCRHKESSKHERLKVLDRICRPLKVLNRHIAAVVLLAGIVLCGISFSKLNKPLLVVVKESVVLDTSAGEIRDVDIDRVREMIRNGSLSNREAEYYEKADNINKNDKEL